MTGKRDAAQLVTRELVLSAARTLFAAKGYEGANIREIAAAAGRSTGSIFGNWADKESLFEAAMGRKAPLVELRDFLTQVDRGHYNGGVSDAFAARLLRDLWGRDACISA